MMTTPNEKERPITPMVIYDLPKALKRIKAIEFLDDKVVIQLVDSSHGSKFSMNVLKIRLHMKDGTISSMQFLDDFADWDDEAATFTIQVANVVKITFSDTYDTQEICKP